VGVAALIALSACREKPRPTTPDGGAPDGGGVDAGLACAAPRTVLDDRPCACPSDCTAGATCAPESFNAFAGGSCTRACRLPFGETSECTENADCFELDSVVSVCAQRCATSEDCPRGRICGEGLCFAFCTADSQCDSGHCEANKCTDGAPLPGLAAFDPCVRDDDCKSAICSSVWSRCNQYCSTARQDCPAGMVCAANFEESGDLGLCFPDCAPDRPCADPALACQWAGRPYGTYACTPRRDPPCQGASLEVSVGGPCSCAFDCGIESSCYTEAGTGRPGGFCVDACHDETDCPEGFSCEGDTATELGTCYQRCVGDGPCGAGKVCSLGTCISFCRADTNCSAGRICDVHRNRCFDTPAPGQVTGGPCRSSDECASNFCSDNTGGQGMCIQQCLLSADACPDGTVCHDTASDDDVGLCVPRCSPTEPCVDPGFVCTPSAVPAGVGTVCQ